MEVHPDIDNNNVTRSTLAKVFVSLELDKSIRILDVACGTGIVAEELRNHGYSNIDGLDPVAGYLKVAEYKRLYKVMYM